MRIVITGGTGFVGQALGHVLIGRGAEAVVLTRGRSSLFAHACRECGIGSKVELVTWTPEEPGSWMSRIDGADAVINLAGAGIGDERWTPERKALLRSSRVRSTDLVARAIAQATKKPRVFISGSAVGYYGSSSGDRILDESDGPGTGFLAELVRDWEAAAEPARQAGVRTCHPRLGLVLGKKGGMLAKMLPLFRAFVGGPVGSGDQYMSWIHMRDVVSALELLLDRDDLSGPFNLTAPEPVTMDTFAADLGQALHRPAKLRVPEFAVKLAMGEASEIALSGQRVVPKRLVGSGFAFVFPDLTSALSDLV